MQKRFKLTFIGYWYNQYVLVPAIVVTICSNYIATIIFVIWIVIKSYLIWAKTIGGILAFILHIFFWPLALIVAPFITLIRDGFMMFVDTLILFLTPILWTIFISKFFFINYLKLAPLDSLVYSTVYSPRFFMVGALSFQIISLPFYLFRLSVIGDVISWCGVIFLLFTLLQSLNWLKLRKRLSKEEKKALYRPSFFVYILGFLFIRVLGERFLQAINVVTTAQMIVIGCFLYYLIYGWCGKILDELLEVFEIITDKFFPKSRNL